VFESVKTDVAVPPAGTTTDAGVQLPVIAIPAGAPQFRETVPAKPPAEASVRVYVGDAAVPTFTVRVAKDDEMEKLATAIDEAALAENAPLPTVTFRLLTPDALLLLFTVTCAVALPFRPTGGVMVKVAGQVALSPEPPGTAHVIVIGTLRLNPVVVVAVTVNVALPPAVID
jgi:hypothetical protein